jgi:hypothetical protein
MRSQASWTSQDLHDLLGNEFSVGDKVAKAFVSGRSPNIEIRTVREIKADRLYLDDSKVPVIYPSRMLIVSKLFTE